MKNKTAILIPEATYHVYNRANGNERLFVSDDNYRFFLNKYIHYISPVADTFCYCLMPNHFHFLLRIKSENALKAFFTAVRRNKDPQGFENLEGLRDENPDILISHQFSKFFNAYAKAFNKVNNRKGSLFMHPFKRKQVNDVSYLRNLAHYIHYNPVESKLCHSLQDWPYSSYSGILLDKSDFLETREVIDWFDDQENFLHFHSQRPGQEITAL